MKEASQAQIKLFFALVDERGFEKEEIKERAKKKFSLESFSKISSQQISELIEKLQGNKEPKPKEKHSHDFELEAKSDKHNFYSCKCGTLVTEPR